MNRRHSLPIGVEGDLCDARTPRSLVFVSKAAFLGDDDERPLGRVTDDLDPRRAGRQAGVVAEERATEELAQGTRVGYAAILVKAAERLVPCAFDLEPAEV